LHFLQKKAAISGERLSAVGYGEYRPIASNGTAQNRALNRRIQIVLTASKDR
jgi:chemotaxis protein MotB